MPSFEEHRAESVRLFGRPFEEVHRWLDEFAGRSPAELGDEWKRHHESAIIEVRLRWGPEAAAAARLHVVSDLKSEGWTEDKPFPKHEWDYVKMGLVGAPPREMGHHEKSENLN
jgi:hypothetical protein